MRAHVPTCTHTPAVYTLTLACTQVHARTASTAELGCKQARRGRREGRHPLSPGDQGGVMLMENYVSDLSWKDYQDFRYGNADYLFFVGEQNHQQRDM